MNKNEFNFNAGSAINGKVINQMPMQELLAFIRDWGSRMKGDVNVYDDNGKLLARYDSKDGNAYYYGAIPAGTVFNLPK